MTPRLAAVVALVCVAALLAVVAVGGLGSEDRADRAGGPEVGAIAAGRAARGDVVRDPAGADAEPPSFEHPTQVRNPTFSPGGLTAVRDPKRIPADPKRTAAVQAKAAIDDTRVSLRFGLRQLGRDLKLDEAGNAALDGLQSAVEQRLDDVAARAQGDGVDLESVRAELERIRQTLADDAVAALGEGHEPAIRARLTPSR